MRCRLFAVFPPHQIYTHISIVSRKVSSAPISRGCNHSPAIQFNWHSAGSEIVRKCAPASLERRHKLLSLNWYLSLSVECMSGPSGPLSLSLPHYLLLCLSPSLCHSVFHTRKTIPLSFACGKGQIVAVSVND